MGVELGDPPLVGAYASSYGFLYRHPATVSVAPRSSLRMKKSRVLYLFPHTQQRLAGLDDVLGGQPCPERFLYYGMDYLLKQGWDVRHNLAGSADRATSRFLNGCHRAYFGRHDGYAGRLDWVLPGYADIRRVDALIAITAHVAFPVLLHQWSGWLRDTPMLYLAVGLPERLETIRRKRPEKYLHWCRRLSTVARIVTVSQVEAETLKHIHGLDNVSFLVPGVDTDYFLPIPTLPSCDVLSIGADAHRDFDTLVSVARRLSAFKFKIVTNKAHADRLRDLPQNIKVEINIPMQALRDTMAASVCMALPVRPNTYSGATTVLLQAMAMAKAVVANPVGANAAGYPFRHAENLLFVTPQDVDALCDAVLTLCGDEGLRSSLGAAARRAVIAEASLEGFHHEIEACLQKFVLKA